jgi:hypothetical protein
MSSFRDRKQVIEAVTGGPLKGDLNEDGVVDAYDINLARNDIGLLGTVARNTWKRLYPRLLNAMRLKSGPPLPLKKVRYAQPDTAIQRAKSCEEEIVVVDFETKNVTLEQVAELVDAIHGFGKLAFIGSVPPEFCPVETDCICQEMFLLTDEESPSYLYERFLRWVGKCRGIHGDDVCIAPWVHYMKWGTCWQGSFKLEDWLFWLNLIKRNADFTLMWDGGVEYWYPQGTPFGPWYWYGYFAMCEVYGLKWKQEYFPKE